MACTRAQSRTNRSPTAPAPPRPRRACACADNLRGRARQRTRCEPARARTGRAAQRGCPPASGAELRHRMHAECAPRDATYPIITPAQQTHRHVTPQSTEMNPTPRTRTQTPTPGAASRETAQRTHLAVAAHEHQNFTFKYRRSRHSPFTVAEYARGKRRPNLRTMTEVT